jgi:hypothetical protein
MPTVSEKGGNDMHLYDETLDRYLARDLPPETMFAIDVHVSNCLQCADGLADTHDGTGRWERRGLLGRLVRVEEPISVGAGVLVEERRAEAA